MSKLQLLRPAGKQPTAAQPQPERPQVPLLETDPAKGLTAEQAAQRMAAGLDNHAAASPTRSETEIIRDNIFTFFNLVFIVLALCLALVGSFANMTFLGVVIANTIIGTVQQLRSKRTVDQLTLVAAHKVRCLRDGKSCPAKSWCGMTLWSLPPANRSVQTLLCAPAALRRTKP